MARWATVYRRSLAVLSGWLDTERVPDPAPPVARAVADGATRLSALDASFLALERSGYTMNVGGVVVFDRNDAAPAVTRPLLRERLVARSQRLRRLRQRLYDVPMGAGRPVWDDDPAFDVDDHLTEAELPSPGGLGQIERYVAEHHSRPFDLDEPLWHCTLLNGVADGRVAVYMRFQHAFVDGLRGIALGAGIFDDPREAQQPVAEPVPTEQPIRPRLGILLAEATAEEGARVMRRAWEFTLDGIDPLSTLRREQRLLTGMLGFLDSPSPHTPLNRRVGPHRRMTFRELDQPALTATRRRYKVDLPTAVLAVVAGALAQLFDARGQLCPAVRTLVPLANSRGSVYGNDAAFVLVDLPTGHLAHEERVRAIAQAFATARATQLPASRALLSRWNDDGPISNALVAEVGNNDDSAGALVSFLRWPRPPPPLFGHPYRITYPTLPVGARLGLMVGVVEIGGRLAVGLASDPAIVPEAQFLVVSMGQTLTALATG